MRKPILSALAVLAMLANLPASAITITDTQNVNTLMNSGTPSISVTHTVPSLTLYTSGLLTILLADDSDPCFIVCQGESFITNVGVSGGGLFGNISGQYSTSFGLIQLLGTSLSGTFQYTLARLTGDFYFRTSTLELEAPFAGGTSVPEPGSLMLLGAGLLGLSVLRRRRRAE